MADPELTRHGLTAEAFEALLARLDPDRERAGVRYAELYCRLVRLFEWRGCDSPEDLADETMNRVARRLAEGTEIHKPDPFGYFCGVAHLVYKEVWRRQERERRVLEAERPAGPAWPPGPDPDDDRRLLCMRRCLAALPEDQRRLILSYHGEDEHVRSRQRLAQELGIEMNALRIRAYRARRDLMDCIRRCLAGHR